METESEDDAMSVGSSSASGKTFPCPHPGCKAQFSKRGRLTIHVRTHTGERPYVCDEPGCGKDFMRSEHLTRHKANAHNSNNAASFPCELCPKSYASRDALRKHERQAHPPERQQEEDGQKHLPHRCDQCGATFAKRNWLRSHVSAVHEGDDRPHVCDICGQRFKFPNKLRIHVESKHANRPCPKGDKTFGTFAEWRRHHAEEHGKQHHCKHCGETFKLKSAYEDHIIKHQDEIDVYVCKRDGCGK